MDSLFYVGKEIGELKAEIEKMKSNDHKNGGCGGSSKTMTNRQMTTTDAKNLQTICGKSGEIRQALQKALDAFGLKGESGEKFHISSFMLTTIEHPEYLGIHPMSCVCCSNGSYSCCSPDPCTPPC